MRNRVVTIIVVLAAVLVGVLPAQAAVNTQAALAYLKSQQNEDGGFGSGFGPGSTVSSTADVVMAIVAAGGNPATFAVGANTPLTYLAKNASSAATAGELSKLILALVAAGENPRDVGGVDSVAKLEGMIRTDGWIGGTNDTFSSVLTSVLALASVQRPIPAASVGLIKTAQQENGGWAWDGSSQTAADTNTTALAVEALVAGGMQPTSDPLSKAMGYYRAIQNEDGGWPYQNPSDFGTVTDANSTAVAIQAIIAAGQDPAGAAWAKAGGATPVSALEALQNASGAFAWKADTPGDNLLATVQALPAVAGKAFPLAAMNVGPEAPTTLPTTGGALANPAVLLVLGGAALAVGGYALRRRR